MTKTTTTTTKTKTTNNNGRKRRPRGKQHRPQRAVGCWEASILDPFRFGPCPIPDTFVTPTCEYSSLVQGGQITITDLAAIPTTSVGGGAVFLANPVINYAALARNTDNATTADIVNNPASPTSYSAPNLDAMMPIVASARRDMYLCRLTSMGVVIRPKVGGYVNTALELVVGLLPPYPINTDNPVNGYSINNIGTSEILQRLQSKHVLPFVNGSEYRLLYPVGHQPMVHFWADSDTVAEKFDKLVTEQEWNAPGLVVWAQGEVPNVAVQSVIDYDVVYHWQVMPIKSTAMTTRPSKNVADSRAVDSGINNAGTLRVTHNSSRDVGSITKAPEPAWLLPPGGSGFGDGRRNQRYGLPPPLPPTSNVTGTTEPPGVLPDIDDLPDYRAPPSSTFQDGIDQLARAVSAAQRAGRAYGSGNAHRDLRVAVDALGSIYDSVMGTGAEPLSTRLGLLMPP